MLDPRFDQEFREFCGGHICGVDEAGRGPLCGPVAAGAVVLPEGLVIEGLNDSKKLTEKKRDKLYDEIEEIETLIEEVETRLYNIRQEKISGDNVYQFLLFFDKLYDRFTDIEKKTFMKSFLADVNIYEEEQADGRILRSLKFRFPVFFNGKEIYELDWDSETTVETVCLLSRKAQ